MIVPPPPTLGMDCCTAIPGSEEWAHWQLANAFTDDADRRAITDVVASGMLPHPSAWRARVHYARACGERCWPGWQAKLAWAIVEALLADPLANDDDIPF